MDSESIKKLDFLKEQLKDIENVNELNMFYMANKRKYWWVNFFIAGLYQAMSGENPIPSPNGGGIIAGLYQAMNGKIKYIIIYILVLWASWLSTNYFMEYLTFGFYFIYFISPLVPFILTLIGGLSNPASIFPLILFILGVYCLINGRDDQNEFNSSLQIAISKRGKEIKEETNEKMIKPYKAM
ncbi:MAG: hypothetical protein LBT66_05445 [Methanobrevibacter sp.]|jgi:hypothetical protein|nr:hypothetical protein [Candidatus Methanovirga meridionalis]